MSALIIAPGFVAWAEGGVVRAERFLPEGADAAAALPALAADLMAGAPPPALIAVLVGPGRFTGLRAGLALAHGLALGGGASLVGVSVAEAVAAMGPDVEGRMLWVATASGRDRLFLERDGGVAALAPADLPPPAGPVAVAGDAAPLAAAILAAREADVRLTAVRAPSAPGILAAAERRAAGHLPPRPVLPLYVEPPETRAPATPPRPPPVPDTPPGASPGAPPGAPRGGRPPSGR